MTNIRRSLIIGLLILFWTFSCQENRFTGYNYEAQQPPDQTIVEGRILDLFTGIPVGGVTVNAEGQQAMTTSDGQYELSYNFTGDERFNRPIRFIFGKINYIPDTSSLIIGLFDNRLDAVLEYGAPIIEDARLVDSLCITTIFDYQADVDSVYVTPFYYDPDSVHTFTNHLDMMLVRQIDSLRSDYQAIISDSLTKGPYRGGFTGRYDITATDRRGFMVRQIFYRQR